MPDRRSLPPMEAIEFAIAMAFRHCFFAVGLVLGWSLALLPLAALAWFVALRGGTFDVRTLTPSALAALCVFALGVLVACLSMGVN